MLPLFLLPVYRVGTQTVRGFGELWCVSNVFVSSKDNDERWWRMMTTIDGEWRATETKSRFRSIWLLWVCAILVWGGIECVRTKNETRCYWNSAICSGRCFWKLKPTGNLMSTMNSVISYLPIASKLFLHQFDLSTNTTSCYNPRHRVFIVVSTLLPTFNTVMAIWQKNFNSNCRIRLSRPGWYRTYTRFDIVEWQVCPTQPS